MYKGRDQNAVLVEHHIQLLSLYLPPSAERHWNHQAIRIFIMLSRVALYTVGFSLLGRIAASHWHVLAPLPIPRQEHSTVALNTDTIAVVGGVVPNEGSGSVQAPPNTTDLVQLYSVSSNTWRNVAPIPFRVNHPNVASVDGRIYVLGGLVDEPSTPPNSISWIASGESYMYDPQQNLWTVLDPIPSGEERGSAIVGVHDQMIYLAGGMKYLNVTGQDAIASLVAFNTSSERWQSVSSAAANLPGARQHAAGAVVHNVFYVACGRVSSQVDVRSTVFALDFANQRRGWTTVGHFPTARGGVTGAVVGSRFFNFGGEGNVKDPRGIFNQTEAFDLKTGEAATYLPMVVPRHGTSAAAIGNRIYIPGGGRQQDGLNSIINGTIPALPMSDRLDVYVV